MWSCSTVQSQIYREIMHTVYEPDIYCSSDKSWYGLPSTFHRHQCTVCECVCVCVCVCVYVWGKYISETVRSETHVHIALMFLPGALYVCLYVVCECARVCVCLNVCLCVVYIELYCVFDVWVHVLSVCHMYCLCCVMCFVCFLLCVLCILSCIACLMCACMYCLCVTCIVYVVCFVWVFYCVCCIYWVVLRVWCVRACTVCVSHVLCVLWEFPIVCVLCVVLCVCSLRTWDSSVDTETRLADVTIVVPILTRSRYFYFPRHVQTSSGVHWTFYLVDTGGSILNVKAGGSWSWSLISICSRN
jgi:hypothetical protein